jgi:hypothetical protein
VVFSEHFDFPCLLPFYNYFTFVSFRFFSFRFAVLPSSTYLFTAGVGGFYLHLITLRHTPQSVGLLWTRDRPVAETCTWQHKHSQETNIHAPGGIRTHDPSKRSAADRAATGIGCFTFICVSMWQLLCKADRQSVLHKLQSNHCDSPGWNCKGEERLSVWILWHDVYYFALCFDFRFLQRSWWFESSSIWRRVDS